jgi:N-methylhydantoinase B
MSVDVVTAEIVRNGMVSAAAEMARTLVRTAYNPLLYDVQDYGLGIVSADGRLWAEAPGVTLFVGVLSDTVKGGIAKLGATAFAEGDVVIANDPYLTGTHISDTTVYVPVFQDGEHVAFCVATAHWADIGGKTPGGWCPDSTDVYQEGICFSHEKLVAGGVPNDALWSVILNNVRYPATVRGDLEAKIAACRQGSVRVQALCAKHGVQQVRESMAIAIRRTDEAARRRISEIPDGVWSAALEMDHDGVDRDSRYRLAIQLHVAGDRIRVSFDGTSPTRGGPVNVPALGSRSAVRAAIKGLLLPTDPANEGDFLALDFELPPGFVVSPERPAPVDSYGYVCVALNELVLRAMSQAVPDRCPAGGNQLFGVFLFRVDPGAGVPFILIDPMDVGNGGRPFEDGPTMMFLGNGDVPNTPVEVVENRYPLRVDRFEYLPEVAGHGAFRGGLGARRDYRVLGEGTFMQTAIENTFDPTAGGLDGGTDGAPSTIVVNPGTDRETRVAERASFFGPLGPGDVVSVRSGGGGGWGSPLLRDPERVAADVRDGFVTVEEARDVYGVALVDRSGSIAVDSARTAALRDG